ncbi:MAG: OprO/OprP family phosphate-selective porin [Bacteriovoracaceae bacterium]|jgi:hypothetical protein|nr:OprO/OprP family phosphate-selective porin [Bacteriovoracaceae bacterium]
MKIFMLLIITSVSVFSKNIDELNLDIRSDFTQQKSSDDTKNFLGFQTPFLWLEAKGKPYQFINFRIRSRQNFSSVQDQTSKLPSKVDLAYLEYNYSKKIKFRFGKQPYIKAGNEYQYLGLDVYQFSSMNTGKPVFENGLTSYIKQDNHQFNFQVMNGRKENSNKNGESVNSQESLSASFMYSGLFFRNTLRLNFSLNSLRYPGTDYVSELIFSGLKYSYSSYFIEVEHLRENQKEASQILAGKSVVNTSNILKIALSKGKVRPHVKLYLDKQKDYKTKIYEKRAVVAALQYHPFNNDSFRYHIAYANINSDMETSVSYEQKLVLGFRLKTNFLK